MKALMIAAILLISPATSFAQKSVTEYTDSQRSALQAAIRTDPTLSFIPESWFDADSLDWVRNDPEMAFGKNYKPYYQSGDFNKDGFADFAVILLRRSVQAKDPEELVVLVFNGSRSGRYALVHTEREPFATTRLIRNDGEALWVGLLETDDIGCFIPAGAGYIVEPCS